MKKSSIILFFVLLITGLMPPSAYGQQFYVGIDAGYGLKINSSNYGWYNDSYDRDGSVSTYNNVRFSLGQGLQTGVAAGCMFNNNFGIEVGLAYQIGAPIKSHYYVSDTTGSSYENMNFSKSAQSIRITPAFIMQAKPDATFSPFLKMGLICSMASMEEIHEGVDYMGDYIVYRWNYSKGINLGALSSLGAVYNINDKLALVGEFKIQLLSYAPEKSEYTECTVNGVDLLPGMTTSDKITEYVDSYSYDPHVAQSPTEPKTTIKETYSLNSYGFQLGLRINL